MRRGREVYWDFEIDRRILEQEAWSSIGARGFDAPRHFSAFLHTLHWNCVTATDPNLFQSPFRAGIRIDAYQMEPLRKALRLPRVNLFIADDTGLGKTIDGVHRRGQTLPRGAPEPLILLHRHHHADRAALPGHTHGRALRRIEQVAEAILGFSGGDFPHVAKIATMTSFRNCFPTLDSWPFRRPDRRGRGRQPARREAGPARHPAPAGRAASGSSEGAWAMGRYDCSESPWPSQTAGAASCSSTKRKQSSRFRRSGDQGPGPDSRRHSSRTPTTIRTLEGLPTAGGRGSAGLGHGLQPGIIPVGKRCLHRK